MTKEKCVSYVNVSSKPKQLFAKFNPSQLSVKASCTLDQPPVHYRFRKDLVEKGCAGSKKGP